MTTPERLILVIENRNGRPTVAGTFIEAASAALFHKHVLREYDHDGDRIGEPAEYVLASVAGAAVAAAEAKYKNRDVEAARREGAEAAFAAVRKLLTSVRSGCPPEEREALRLAVRAVEEAAKGQAK